MPEQYAHTLIAEDLDFIPQPQQVAAFYDGLIKLKAAPAPATLKVMKLSGKSRTFTNPVTGEKLQIRDHKHVPLESSTAIPKAIAELDHYNVIMSGEGPPKLPALTFKHKGMYEFLVHCCLRSEVVSTSSCHGEVPITRKVPSFDEPFSSTGRTGFFQHPDSDKIIKVPKAGCARFWIEFEYGRWLFPKMKDGLKLMNPSIVASVQKCFGTKFVQGCHWCG